MLLMEAANQKHSEKKGPSDDDVKSAMDTQSSLIPEKKVGTQSSKLRNEGDC